MNRRPVVAGQFYPGGKEELLGQVRQYLSRGEAEGKGYPLAMVPHAGYVFSGPIAGKTLARARPAPKVVLLGPNHTGQGQPFSVWASGQWELPGFSVEVEENLAGRILAAHSEMREDHKAHLYEHSLEVVLPFLYALNEETRVVPVSVAETDLDRLIEVGQALSGVISDEQEPVSVVVSSDMSHFIPAQTARQKDEMALQSVYAVDPEGLYQTVRKNSISMCGVLPMTVGLALARKLGCSRGELVEYANSGDFIGDYSQVVGYAGVVIS